MFRAVILLHRTSQRLPARAQLSRAALALLAAAMLPGCVYRMDIQQGNYLEGKTVDKLEVGMTRTQVRYLLGTPMVPDVFDKDRWDYLYYFQRGRTRRIAQRHLVVFFKEDKVMKFVRDNVPESAPQAPDQGAPIEKFPKI
jgi:outer membrane protein assembly factor BamE